MSWKTVAGGIFLKMEGKINPDEPGILFPDTELDIVPLDKRNDGPFGNGRRTTAGPEQIAGIPVSRQVIHTPKMRSEPPRQWSRQNSSHEGSKLLWVLTVVAVVVAVIALLLGSFGVVRRGDIFVNVSSGNAVQASEGQNATKAGLDDRIWTFAIGDYNVNLEYLDRQLGQIRGYNVDIINAVCRIANKNCQLVWDLYENCWRNVAGQPGRSGIGLQGRWYDACTAWAVTYNRDRTFKFTTDMSKPHLSIFMVALGTAPNAFNWRDLRGKTIGFLQSYVEDEICLGRYPEITGGGNLTVGQVRYYFSEQALLSAVTNKEVDAVLLDEHLQVTTHLQLASDRLDRCAIGGQAMMMRKDATVSDWWNPAFQTLLESPEYLAICRGLEDPDAHGNLPGPTMDEHCIGF